METAGGESREQNPPPPPSGGVDVENQARGLGPELGPMPGTETAANAAGSTNGKQGGGCSFVEEWKKEDLMSKVALSLRAAAFVLSFLSLVIMASNNHDYGLSFDAVEQYRYVLAIAVITFVYTGAVSFLKCYRLSTRVDLMNPKLATLIDFVGDQVIAYLLISSSSAGAALTNAFGPVTNMDSASATFVSSAAGAVSMSFLAFFALATSALVSGYKLSTQAFSLRSTSS